MARKQIEIPASPKRLIGGLSDLAYSPQGSICDIIDNSISHGKASKIFVLFDFNEDNQQFEFLIYDNGISMDFKGLKNAMQLGSSDEYKDPDANLGKYGMGLKTASLAYSDSFSMLAKHKDDTPRLIEMNKALIEEKDKWLYNQLTEKDLDNEIVSSRKYLKSVFANFTFFPKNGSYTLLKWNQINGLNEKAEKYVREGPKNTWITGLVVEVESHIRMVFNRFINGKHGLKKIEINYNGIKLKGWDPCQPNLKGTNVFKIKGQKTNTVEYLFPDSNKGGITLTQYLVSNTKKDEEKVKLINYSLKNRPVKLENMQGLYVYRNNRLIDYGKWLDNVGSDPHSSHARAELNLNSDHDHFFRLDVNKTQIDKVDNDHFMDWLKPFMQKLRAADKKRGKSLKKPKVSKAVNKKQAAVTKVISQLTSNRKVSVKTVKGRTTVINSYGSFFVDEIKSRGSKKNILTERISSKKLSNSQYLWKVIPDVDKTMKVMINELNELHKLYFDNVEKNKKQVDIINAFLLALSFAELTCKSKGSEKVFEDINLAIGDLLNKLIENKIIK